MREILFRGKRTDGGEWVFGCYYKQSKFYGDEMEDHIIITSHEDLSFDQALDYYAVQPKTVGQFTGLYNAANQKIWEGDIVRFGNANYVVQREDETPGGYWASTEYIMKEIGVCDYMSFVDTIDDYYNEICVEIIGNIHDNPELLGG